MAPSTLPLPVITVTLILLHQTLITTASPLAPISLYATTNITTPATPAIPNNIQCFDSSDFVTRSFLAGDCYTAIFNFQDSEIDGFVSSFPFHFLPTLSFP